MPRLKKRESPYDKLLKLLHAYEIDGVTLAAIIGKSPGTGCRRLRCPGEISLDELRALNRAGVPIDEIRAAIN